ncbi:hypothetical protein NGF19_27365 [Streptomyces sp. RY43-2]|uniref:Secreted protein n=1 Tax=Streptomyces macrolidinus TaxID=2952607 RepID=A0ABT0ZLS2_9ACTN|nr:hypothetical protein [Streptomyces macrolidinus]MCN9244457.1 hypothetical protein [Streptomyces macrolidinus]
MMIRHVGKLRRAGAAAVLAAALAVSVTACNSDDGSKKPTNAASEKPAGDNGKSDGGKTLPDTSKAIATLKGSAPGIEMVLYSVTRDEGGFVTVSGEFKNTGDKFFTTPVQWSGTESDVKATGASLAGMTLVDSKEKKRYYVLRDTDNRPLTTTKYASSIRAGETLPFFAQFPAPPESTTKVDLQFPGFPNAPIEIS